MQYLKNDFIGQVSKQILLTASSSNFYEILVDTILYGRKRKQKLLLTASDILFVQFTYLAVSEHLN